MNEPEDKCGRCGCQRKDHPPEGKCAGTIFCKCVKFSTPIKRGKGNK